MSSSVCKFTLFADDTSLFYSHSDKIEGAKILNSELSNIANWLAANKLSLNVSKSKLLIFCKKQTNKQARNNTSTATDLMENTEVAEDTSEMNICINGEKLKEVDHAKYLGALIINKLSWSFHINSVNLKLSKGSGLLAKARHYVPSDTLRSLYFSFINPYIDYNLLNWGMASPTNLSPIYSKMKRAVRIMTFKGRDHHTAGLFQELEILPLDKFIQLRYGKFMWRLNNGFLPQSLAKNFHMNRRNQLSNSFSRLESLKQFVLFAGPQLWNELPSEITNKPSLNSFSSALKNYLMGKPISNNRNNGSRCNNANQRNLNNHVSSLANNRRINLPFVSRWDLAE